MNDSEKKLCNNECYLQSLNDKLKIIQFTEEFLIYTINYYSSNICLKYQKNLKPYFCFRYLYNKNIENINDRVYYNNIIDYYRGENYKNEYSMENLIKIYDIALKDKLKINDSNYITIIKPFYICNGICNKCNDYLCDF